MPKQKILSVDDDEDILRLFSTLFERSGYDFMALHDPSLAHEKIIQTSPDLVTLDFLMPDFDIYPLVRKLKSSAITGSIPLIVVTRSDESEIVEKLLKLGVDDIIRKPFEPMALLAKVKTHLERKLKKEHTQELVERYINPYIAKRIFSDEKNPEIRNRRVHLAVLFADIRGFTYLASLLEPEDVFKILNALLDAYSHAILNMGGTIDKFIGDGIMAFWGAPTPCPDKEISAVKAALGIQEATRKFNEKRTIPGGLEIQVGIGINSGHALVGAVGGEYRKDYTAIGEVVNLASRFEGIAGSGDIIIGEALSKKIRGQFTTVFGGKRSLAGVPEPVKIFKVIS